MERKGTKEKGRPAQDRKGRETKENKKREKIDGFSPKLCTECTVAAAAACLLTKLSRGRLARKHVAAMFFRAPDPPTPRNELKYLQASAAWHARKLRSIGRDAGYCPQVGFCRLLCALAATYLRKWLFSNGVFGVRSSSRKSLLLWHSLCICTLRKLLCVDLCERSAHVALRELPCAQSPTRVAGQPASAKPTHPTHKPGLRVSSMARPCSRSRAFTTSPSWSTVRRSSSTVPTTRSTVAKASGKSHVTRRDTLQPQALVGWLARWLAGGLVSAFV